MGTYGNGLFDSLNSIRIVMAGLVPATQTHRWLRVRMAPTLATCGRLRFWVAGTSPAMTFLEC